MTVKCSPFTVPVSSSRRSPCRPIRTASAMSRGISEVAGQEVRGACRNHRDRDVLPRHCINAPLDRAVPAPDEQHVRALRHSLPCTRGCLLALEDLEPRGRRIPGRLKDPAKLRQATAQRLAGMGDHRNRRHSFLLGRQPWASGPMGAGCLFTRRPVHYPPTASRYLSRGDAHVTPRAPARRPGSPGNRPERAVASRRGRSHDGEHRAPAAGLLGPVHPPVGSTDGVLRGLAGVHHRDADAHGDVDLPAVLERDGRAHHRVHLL